MLKNIILLLIIFIISPIVSAESSDLKFNYKFSANYSIGITQDKEGFIWLGTANGLLKYDGYTLKTFQESPDGLSSNIAPVVFADSEGLIWIGTAGGGLNVYDKRDNSFTVYRHDAQDLNSISSDSFLWAVDQIAEDNDGLIWAGTSNGLNSFDKKTGHFTRYFNDPQNPESLSHNEVWAVCPDSEGLIWIATKNGLNSFDKKTGKFTRYVNDPDNPQSLSDNWIYSVIEDSQGYMWIGTQNGGLNRFDKKSGLFSRYKNDPGDPYSLHLNEVFFLREDSKGDIWIGRSYSNPIGLERFIIDEEKFILYSHEVDNPYSLPGNFVQSFMEDRSGILWIVDDLGPVSTLDRQQQRFDQFIYDPDGETGISSNMITTIIEDSTGNIWFGTVDAGLFCYKREKDEFIRFQYNPEVPGSIPHNYVYSVLEDADGKLWIGSDDGNLSIFNRNTGQAEQSFRNNFIQEAPQGLIQDKLEPSLLWFGTGSGGVFSFNKNTGEYTQYSHDPSEKFSLGNNSAGKIFQDEDGVIWASTLGGGLNRFNRDSGTFTSFVYDEQDSSSIGSNEIRDIFIDSQGTFWVSTSGGGLNKFNRKAGVFRRFDRESGFPVDIIFTIKEDDSKNLWLTTDSGLIKFSIESETVLNIYTEADGLQGNIFNFFPTSSLMTQDGQMWICGNNGVNTFYPGEISDNPYIPPVYLTSVKQGGEEIDLPSAPELVEQLDLNWQDNFFEFEFTALNYTLSEKNRFAYMLEGVDKEWYYSDEKRFGRFSAIPDGPHLLKIKGSNNDGIWNEAGTSILVHVKAPFWRTLPFRILIVISSIFIFISIIKRREYVTQKLNMLLQKTVDERTRELKAINEELVVLSLTDPLTKLNNRRYLYETVSDDLSRIDRIYHDWNRMGDSSNPPPAKTAFLMLDLDYFKSLNDRFGHIAGDKVLVETAERLRSICRKNDKILRWGGEEFLIVSSGDVNEPHTLAERILENFQNNSFKIDEENSVFITCSIGIAGYPFFPVFYTGVNWNQIISIADIALYAAKHSGRNGYIEIYAASENNPENILTQIFKDASRLIGNGELKIRTSFENFKSAAFVKD